MMEGWREKREGGGGGVQKGDRGLDRSVEFGGGVKCKGIYEVLVGISERCV